MTDKIVPRMNAGLFRQLFAGKSFVHTLIELIKNARDSGATMIDIVTRDPAVLVIVDNGGGMILENQKAFASIGFTTSDGKTQHGRFGTGTKHMLYSYCTRVDVTTVSSESDNIVTSFGFNTDEYEQMVLNQEGFVPKTRKKSEKIWPYGHKTGTCLQYVLRDPKSRSILRDERLAIELAARLSMKFLDIVTVDGEPLPEKKVIGGVYTRTFTDTPAALGTVTVEIYRPEKRHADDGLRLGSIEMGEVSMENLRRAIGDRAERIPFVFLRSDVCGTIIASALHTHVNDDRMTLNAAVADSQALEPFLRLLRRIEPEVCDMLDLVEDTESHADAKAVVQELVERITGVYGMVSAERQTPGEDPVGGDVGGGKGSGGGTRTALPVTLSINRTEFEPGEEIRLQARLNTTSADDVKTLKWNTRRSGAKVVSQDGVNCVLSAGEALGTYTVSVDVPGTPHSASVRFEVVAERQIHIRPRSATIKVAQPLFLTCINADKFGSSIVWQCSGTGTVQQDEQDPTRATFTAPVQGQAVVSVYDPHHPKRRAECPILIVEQQVRIIKIRDHLFHYRSEPHGNSPVTLGRATDMDDVHDMAICVTAPGCEEAKKHQALSPFMCTELGHAYASFALIRESELGSEISLQTLFELQRDIRGLACEVAAELMAGVPKSA